MTTATPTATSLETPPEPQQPAKKPGLVSRFLFPAIAVVLAVWGVFLATGDKVAVSTFDPAAEFDLSAHEGEHVVGGEWVVGQIFGQDIDLGINKGVVYLLIAVIGCMLMALYVNRTIRHRDRQQSRKQTVVEGIYEFAYDQIATSLGTKLFNRYMPYVASIFIFILLLNLTSFVPLPLNTHHNIGDLDYLYSFGLYAVTSNIYCTVTLALLTFFVYHFEGIRAHGLIGYLGTWSGGQKGPIGWLIFFIEVMSNLVLKPLSLALRLFANMLAGHILILLMLGLAGILAGGILPTLIAQVGGGALALAFYLFEMVLIAGLQAFIFAILSAIYIGGAASEHH